MLDQIRHDIQSRLDEVLGEVDKLRRALAALASRDGNNTPAAAAAKAAAVTAPAPAKARVKAPATKPAATAASSERTAPGATKAGILAALAAAGSPMTAGEIADATGIGRATISTTLSRLAKSGEVDKAERGYQVKA
jgi:DNA-binding transcriptional ArsR family regulator